MNLALRPPAHADRAAWDRLQGFVRLVDVYAAAADRVDASQRAVERSLAAEVVDAYNNTGNVVKKREETHKMAQANRAFAHLRW
jgi:cytochrome c556